MQQHLSKYFAAPSAPSNSKNGSNVGALSAMPVSSASKATTAHNTSVKQPASHVGAPAADDDDVILVDSQSSAGGDTAGGAQPVATPSLGLRLPHKRPRPDANAANGAGSARAGAGASGTGRGKAPARTAAARPTKPSSSPTAPSYTPLEAQVAALKTAWPGTLLLVEAGYRYRAFGPDAVLAARALGLYAHRDHAFMVASIPTHRIGVHTRRLVGAGYRVGVVRQTETAAVKASGTGPGKKSGPFARALVGLYSRGTIGEDEVIGADAVGEEAGAGASSSSGPSVLGSGLADQALARYIACLAEVPLQHDDGAGPGVLSSSQAAGAFPGPVRLALTVLDVTTMAGQWDVWTEAGGSGRPGLAHRLAALAPVEIALLTDAPLSAPSLRALATYVTGSPAGDLGLVPQDVAQAGAGASASAPGGAADASAAVLAKLHKFSAVGSSSHGAQAPITLPPAQSLVHSVLRPRPWQTAVVTSGEEVVDPADPVGWGEDEGDGEDGEGDGDADEQGAGDTSDHDGLGDDDDHQDFDYPGSDADDVDDEDVVAVDDGDGAAAGAGVGGGRQTGKRGRKDPRLNACLPHAAPVRVELVGLGCGSGHPARQVLQAGPGAGGVSAGRASSNPTVQLVLPSLVSAVAGRSPVDDQCQATARSLQATASTMPWPVGLATLGLCVYLGPFNMAAGVGQATWARADTGAEVDGDDEAVHGGPAASPGPGHGPSYLRMPGTTARDLELFRAIGTGTERGSLLSLLHHCSIPGGIRTLAQWLARPLADSDGIWARQDAVACLAGSCGTCSGQDGDGGSQALHQRTVAAVRAAVAAVAGQSDPERVLARLAQAAAIGPKPGGSAPGRPSSSSPSVAPAVSSPSLPGSLLGPSDILPLLRSMDSLGAVLDGWRMQPGGAGQGGAGTTAATTSALLPRLLSSVPPSLSAVVRTAVAQLADGVWEGQQGKGQAKGKGKGGKEGVGVAGATGDDDDDMGDEDSQNDGQAGRDLSSAPYTAATRGGDVTRLLSPATQAALRPGVAHWRAELVRIGAALDSELSRLRTSLGRPGLQWRTVRTGLSSCLEYLLEVPRKEIRVADGGDAGTSGGKPAAKQAGKAASSRGGGTAAGTGAWAALMTGPSSSSSSSAPAPIVVPEDWTEVSATKEYRRFHTAAVRSLLPQLALAREMVAAEARAAWGAWVVSLAGQVTRLFSDALAAVAQMDALCSLAVVARLPGYCRPIVLGRDVPPCLHVWAGRHPVLEAVGSTFATHGTAAAARGSSGGRRWPRQGAQAGSGDGARQLGSGATKSALAGARAQGGSAMGGAGGADPYTRTGALLPVGIAGPTTPASLLQASSAAQGLADGQPSPSSLDPTRLATALAVDEDEEVVVLGDSAGSQGDGAGAGHANVAPVPLGLHMGGVAITGTYVPSDFFLGPLPARVRTGHGTGTGQQGSSSGGQDGLDGEAGGGTVDLQMSSLLPPGCALPTSPLPPRVMVITGPNTGGKSTAVRMAASIALLAHIGSWMPADAAVVGVLDVLTTRMGSTDDIGAGLSTFMVEAGQTAQALRAAQAHPRSLVILDEVGRGTSTHDGTALAVATLRHVSRRLPGRLSVLITHFPEVSAAAEEEGLEAGTGGDDGAAASSAASEAVSPAPTSPGRTAGNYHMAFLDPQAQGDGHEDGTGAQGQGDGGAGAVTLLYRLVPGAAPKSYGLHVARSAGLPRAVLGDAARVAARVREQWARRGHNHAGQGQDADGLHVS